MRRPVTMTVEIGADAIGDASLDAIKRALEQHPILPFYVGATSPLGSTIVCVSRIRVDAIGEQEPRGRGDVAA